MKPRARVLGSETPTQLFRRHFSLGFEDRYAAPKASLKSSPERYAVNLLRGEPARKQQRTVPFIRVMQYAGVALVVAAIALAAVSSTDSNPFLELGRKVATVLLCVSFAIVLLYWTTNNVAYWRRNLKVVPLEVFSWAMITGGIFARQNADLRTLSWSFKHFDFGALMLTCLIALVVFPWVMRRITKFKPRPGLEVIALPFGFGFLLDLARFAAVSWVPSLG